MKKVILTLCSCFVLLLAMPKNVLAETSWGHRANGSGIQQDAYELSMEKTYYDYCADNTGKYYKFKTGAQEGNYVISLLTMVQGAQNSTDRCTAYIKVVDRYGTVLADASAGNSPADYRTDAVGGVLARAMDIVLPVDDLATNTYYYVYITGDDGNATTSLNVLSYFNVEFVPFRPANDFMMTTGEKGELNFSWSNDQPSNTYNSLTPYDGFTIEMTQGDKKVQKYVGNGGVTKFTVAANDPELVALGYPAKSIEVRLGSIQNYRSMFNESKSCSKVIFSDEVYTTIAYPKKTELTIDGIKYKITNAKNGKGEVTVTGFASEKSKVQKLVIGDAIKVGGFNYNITSIEKKAFTGNKNLTEVTIGKNVKTIGEKAFYDCKKLKKVVVKSKFLKKVNKKAFENIDEKAVIKVPKEKVKKYKKLFKGKVKNTVTIKK
ncbi:MAG: hypothetical protein E7302_08250 [Butyrivibrio sp.]|nr:hypothetical protein [Butyrivibrio sp.]